MINKNIFFTLILMLTAAPSPSAIGATDISHVHNIRILGSQILFGTHEGLFQYKDESNQNLISKEQFDVMGLTVSGKILFASGHPGKDSKLPQPVGLIKSIDGGKNWTMVSLQGKVDFHLLEISNREIYGGDSSSGDLLYSNDLGVTWTNKGENSFIDIAPDPRKSGSALAISGGKIFKTIDSFKSTPTQMATSGISAIEWNAKRLIAASGKTLLISKNRGKSWQRHFEFKDNIVALTQSTDLIAVAVGSSILTSSDNGKTFRIR